MSHPTDLDKISDAVHDCLESCRPGRPLLLHLAEYVESLRATPGWTEYEVSQFNRAVRRILAALGDAGWIS
jgi:hypothetical protein